MYSDGIDEDNNNNSILLTYFEGISDQLFNVIPCTSQQYCQTSRRDRSSSVYSVAHRGQVVSLRYNKMY